MINSGCCYVIVAGVNSSAAYHLSAVDVDDSTAVVLRGAYGAISAYAVTVTFGYLYYAAVNIELCAFAKYSDRIPLSFNSAGIQYYFRVHCSPILARGLFPVDLYPSVVGANQFAVGSRIIYCQSCAVRDFE
ncbi:hypothetical protein [Cloacibacillus evryensis]|uniref:hypothetical protein n=1 Tax=Cloacibacillus evryensis TaxID=508460 RepID=UPI00210A5319|nr:hypothetical protein [Cloacibacillus evryensis]MCQ4764210.1 hypothetical protein [Cloacibacillus evryensis]